MSGGDVKNGCTLVLRDSRVCEDGAGHPASYGMGVSAEEVVKATR